MVFKGVVFLTMKSKVMTGFIVIFLVLSVIVLFLVFRNIGDLQKTEDDMPHVIVSILPQRYFVQRIAGDTVKVSVMVQPGHSPETYEPTPRQMADIADASVYFSIGMPFETVLVEKIKDLNRSMLLVDTSEGITLRDFDEGYYYDKEDSHHAHAHAHDHVGIKDPHIWLSPELVKIQVKTICDALVKLEPNKEDLYRTNLNELITELHRLGGEIQQILKDLSIREFMVFHPSWGYFADEYGLRQIPIEIDGKEPTAKELAGIIDFAKEKNIRVIFVQSQFSTGAAERVAESIGGKVVQIDPLAEDYISNLKNLADSLKRELGNDG